MLPARGSGLRRLRQLCTPLARFSRGGRTRSDSVCRGCRADFLVRLLFWKDSVLKIQIHMFDAGRLIMRKYFILPLLLVVAVGLLAPLAFSDTTGSVKGVVKDV